MVLSRCEIQLLYARGILYKTVTFFDIIRLLKAVEMEGSKLPNREYQYYFIKLGKLYYVNGSCKDVKKKEISSYEFTNHESVAFPIDEESIAKKIAEEFGGNIVGKNATFNDYVKQGQRWGNYIDYKKKNTWTLYTVK